MKIAGNNPKVDHVSMSTYTNFGEIMSIGYQDIERKQTYDINQRQNSVRTCKKS